MPPPQQQFYMPPPQQRQQQMSPNNLSGIMGVSNLGQQQQMSRPNYQNPTSIAQLQAMYGLRGPSGGPPQQSQQQMQRQMDNVHPVQQQIIDQAPTREQIENFQRAQQQQDQQQQQMTGRANMSPQDINAARNALGLPPLQQQQQQQQYFRPQQYQQDPYMNYVQNQQQALQQRAIQQTGLQSTQAATQAAQQQQAAQVAQRAAAQGGSYTPISEIQM
jgi:hypothetical protein